MQQLVLFSFSTFMEARGISMRGWPEISIVLRMWMIGGMLAVTGVGLFYVEWLAST